MSGKLVEDVFRIGRSFIVNSFKLVDNGTTDFTLAYNGGYSLSAKVGVNAFMWSETNMQKLFIKDISFVSIQNKHLE